MKKRIALVLVLVLLLSLCACGNAEQTEQPSGAEKAASSETNSLPVILDSNEYNLYTNIFYNQTGGDYAGQTMTKRGVFTVLQDSFNQTTRYYVWGYLDQTKCCDWQWEFVPKDPDSLPKPGSLVEMTGTFCADEAALDGYWFTDASVNAKTVYTGSEGEIDMCTMSATLERVQLINMQSFPQEYEGKSVRLYGRVYSPTELQHPYYDNAWIQTIAASADVPAIGSVVIASGTFTDGTVNADSVNITTEY